MILVVDDYPDAAKMLARYLRYEGFVARPAFSAAEALEQMRAKLPRLVILDHMMPTMTGLEFLEQVRRDPAFAGVNVVMYSAADGQEERARARSLGADWLVKGAALDDLMGRVRREYGIT